MHPVLQSRFQPLRTPSLRRLKTAFSSSGNPSESREKSAPSTTLAAPQPSPFPASATLPQSPLSRASSPSSIGESYISSPTSGISASSTLSKASRFRALIMLRRKPSILDLQLEEEKRNFGMELHMLEPRPDNGFGTGVVGGIFEVLDGKA